MTWSKQYSRSSGISLRQGQKVKISGFGTFSSIKKHARARNPQTGEPITIDSRRVLSFKPSQVLKERVNNGTKPSPRYDADAAPAISSAAKTCPAKAGHDYRDSRARPEDRRSGASAWRRDLRAALLGNPVPVPETRSTRAPSIASTRKKISTCCASSSACCTTKASPSSARTSTSRNSASTR